MRAALGGFFARAGVNAGGGGALLQLYPGVGA